MEDIWNDIFILKKKGQNKKQDFALEDLKLGIPLTIDINAWRWQQWSLNSRSFYLRHYARPHAPADGSRCLDYSRLSIPKIVFLPRDPSSAKKKEEQTRRRRHSPTAVGEWRFAR